MKDRVAERVRDAAPEGARARVEVLQGENAQLQHAVRSHAVVDHAIGVLLAVGRLTPDEGWNVLREVSQRKNIKLHHLAELIIGWARTRSLCDEVRAELDRQLALHGRPLDTDA